MKQNDQSIEKSNEHLMVYQNELSTDLKHVRQELKTVLKDIKEKKTSLRKANTIIYCCSNITRAIVAEMFLNKNG